MSLKSNHIVVDCSLQLLCRSFFKQRKLCQVSLTMLLSYTNYWQLSWNILLRFFLVFQMINAFGTMEAIVRVGNFFIIINSFFQKNYFSTKYSSVPSILLSMTLIMLCNQQQFRNLCRLGTSCASFSKIFWNRPYALAIIQWLYKCQECLLLCLMGTYVQFLNCWIYWFSRCIFPLIIHVDHRNLFINK